MEFIFLQVIVLTVVTLVAGLQAYNNLGRLEDPEFTIKDAVVITPYPGASPEEVELEVTDRIEQAKVLHLHHVARCEVRLQRQTQDQVQRDDRQQVEAHRGSPTRTASIALLLSARRQPAVH